MLTDLEYWYKEVESLLENVCLEKNEKISLELTPPLNFKIKGHNDIDSIDHLRDYFNSRIQKRRELLNQLISKETLVSNKLMERLCISDLDRQKIKQLNNKIANIIESKNDLAINNNNLQNELVNLKDLFNSLQCKTSHQKESKPRITEKIETFQKLSKAIKQGGENINKLEHCSANVAILRKHFGETEKNKTACEMFASNSSKFQDSIREWYALKSQEYLSTKYDDYQRVAKRRSELEERLDQLDDFLLFENIKNKFNLLNQLKDAFAKINSTKTNETDNNYLKTNYIEKYLNGNRRFDPTPELTIQDIFANDDQLEDEHAEEVLNFEEDPSLPETISIDKIFLVTNESSLAHSSNLSGVLPLKKKMQKSDNAFVTKENCEIANTIDEKNIDENVFDSLFMGKWILFYTNYYSNLCKIINSFESDTSQKVTRFKLKSAIINKINFSTKKKASNSELAKVFNFFFDFFDSKPITVENGEQLVLNADNVSMINYAMFTAVTRYIEQIKWDEELMDTVVLIIVSICIKFNEFYNIFCATILNTSVFLKMSTSKVLDKTISFLKAPPEAAALWIQTERSVFSFFYSVQLALKSKTDLSNEIEPCNFKGPLLLVKFVNDVLSIRTPLICCSSFIVSELFNNCFKNLLNAIKKNSLDCDENKILRDWKALIEKIYIYDWEPTYSLIESKLSSINLLNILKTRNEALVCSLKHSLSNF